MRVRSVSISALIVVAAVAATVWGGLSPRAALADSAIPNTPDEALASVGLKPTANQKLVANQLPDKGWLICASEGAEMTVQGAPRVLVLDPAQLHSIEGEHYVITDHDVSGNLWEAQVLSGGRLTVNTVCVVEYFGWSSKYVQTTAAAQTNNHDGQRMSTMIAVDVDAGCQEINLLIGSSITSSRACSSAASLLDSER